MLSRDFVCGLLSLVHPPRCVARTTAMIGVYFDESGSDRLAQVLTLACYVSPADGWCRLAEQWSRVLIGYGLHEFYMKLFAHR